MGKGSCDLDSIFFTSSLVYASVFPVFWQHLSYMNLMVLSVLHNSDMGINHLLQECSKRVTRDMHMVEENSSLMEDMMSLDKLGEALTEQLIDWIYFEQS